jgi:triacylglycerol lipase
MLGSLSPARRRFVLMVCGLVGLCLVAVIASALLRRDPSVHPVDQDAQPPIVLVPGYGGSTTALEVLSASLTRSGRRTAIVHLRGDGKGDLEAQARVLDATVRSAMRDAGTSSVDLVGYSAGGITTRLWLRDFRGGDVARRVLTLGSPHHGTDLAALAGDLTPDTCPTACQQLATDSDLLRALNAGDETPPGPLWVSIWTTDDHTVIPAESARLDGALAFSVQSVCPDIEVSHGDLPRNSVVAAMVVELLGRERPRTPGAQVCEPRDLRP